MKLVRGHDYKIGVSKHYTNYSSAFSDYETGWAYFNRDEELRHHSSGGGGRYGKRVNSGGNEGGIVEVRVDTGLGNLSFMLDGQDYGNAYSSVSGFSDGDLYAAIASLDTGGVVELLEATVN
eukprot:CAMPEP_0201284024 /NCGR_PEP_ID=MMETSP1317-20130820/58448_1 /ASSEMBLY_ACC=CAM_ASM_000770 /TAXON_ID=187299 /ORGANISM="Undescribed Undescribed, Strain Undescribed" /LENGTH=121 /DNA_ID=CAMNT_0047602371 /DNA_START=678 /DNA_END=1046 /DNA_ORIENTATION=-